MIIGKGISWKAIVDKDAIDQLNNLTDWDSFNFKDEQGMEWTIEKISGTEYSLRGTGRGNKTYAGNFTFK